MLESINYQDLVCILGPINFCGWPQTYSICFILPHRSCIRIGPCKIPGTDHAVCFGNPGLYTDEDLPGHCVELSGFWICMNMFCLQTQLQFTLYTNLLSYPDVYMYHMVRFFRNIFCCGFITVARLWHQGFTHRLTLRDIPYLHCIPNLLANQ